MMASDAHLVQDVQKVKEVSVKMRSKDIGIANLTREVSI